MRLVRMPQPNAERCLPDAKAWEAVVRCMAAICGLERSVRGSMRRFISLFGQETQENRRNLTERTAGWIATYATSWTTRYSLSPLDRSRFEPRTTPPRCAIHVVCVSPDRDSGDLPLWFVVVVLTAQFRRRGPPVNGRLATVRREIGFQRRRERVFMAGQVREDELLAKAVIIDGSKWRYCRFCSETNVWSRATGCMGGSCRPCPQEMLVVGRRLRRVIEKTTGW